VDLEYFYKKIAHINNDIITIKKSIYTIINKNHDACISNINSLASNLNSSIATVDTLQTKKNTLDMTIEKYEVLLSNLVTHEKTFVIQLDSLEKSKPSEDVYVHEKKRLEDKIHDSNNIKRKILSALIQLRQEKDNLYLVMDQVEFDNAIMVDGIIQRINDLEMLKS
jgi:DNA repair ATPase RecN